MITERLLFAVHRGTVSGRAAGLIMQNHCLPIACSHIDWEAGNAVPIAPDGFYALWQSTADVEEFFEALRICSIEGGPGERFPQGLYVYEVTYDLEDSADDDTFDHLQGGELRRPRINELEAFTESGAAPWHGVVF